MRFDEFKKKRRLFEVDFKKLKQANSNGYIRFVDKLLITSGERV